MTPPKTEVPAGSCPSRPALTAPDVAEGCLGEPGSEFEACAAESASAEDVQISDNPLTPTAGQTETNDRRALPDPAPIRVQSHEREHQSRGNLVSSWLIQWHANVAEDQDQLCDGSFRC